MNYLPTFQNVPPRFNDYCEPLRLTQPEAVKELDRLAGILCSGIQQLNGLYLRMCDLIRDSQLTEYEIRNVLKAHFPPQRISEFLRVANAPHEIYNHYRTGFFGFKAALNRCRGYRITPHKRLRQRQAQRAAVRLASILGEGSLVVSHWKVSVARVGEPAIPI